MPYDDHHNNTHEVAELIVGLRELMAEHHWPEAEVAERLGIAQTSVHRWLKGEVSSIRPNNLVLLRRLLGKDRRSYPGTIPNTPALRAVIMRAMPEGLNLRALTRMCGYDRVETLRRLLAGELDWYPPMLSAICGALDIDFKDLPIADHERAQLDDAYAHGTQARPAPVIGLAHASALHHANGTIEIPASFWEAGRLEAVPCDGRRYVIVQNEGNFMQDTLLDGDLLFCDIQREPRDGDVVVAHFNDTSVCKRYRQLSSGLILLTSDNPEGATFEVQPDDLHFLLVVTDYKRPINRR